MFARFDGSGDGEPILYLHGFPTSSYDLAPALPLLTKNRRVLCHDHLGFGLSEKPQDYSYSLVEQAEVALAVWRSFGVERGHVVAHDYGTSVATELCARAAREVLPFKMLSVTFCNGSMMLELAKLRVTQRLLRNPITGPAFARLANRRMFVAQMQRILSRPDAVSAHELDLHWWLAEHGGGKKRLPQVSRYLDERVRFRERWIGSLARLSKVGVRVNVVWAMRDPIAVPEIATRVAALAGIQVRWLDQLGHYPMLEDPAAWSAAVEAGLA
ncbi:MAG TPA: alpha/beta hydrolase [Myxococcales bacterium]|nr:alpha/beta hydrolase [Myxococcales bacterium]